MRHLLLLLLFGSFIFSSCQKELDFDTPPDPGAGGGGGTTTTDYQPVSANSEWNYVSVGPTGDYKVVSLGTDSTINGKKYYKFDNIRAGVAPARSYINKENGIYTTYATATSAGGATIPDLNLVYLKDAAVGTTWTNDITYMGTTSHHKYTVAAKGISKSVGSNTFTNVIQLDYLLTAASPLGGPDLQIGDGKYFYSKGVGFIESDLSSGFAGFVITDTTRLASYTIH